MSTGKTANISNDIQQQMLSDQRLREVMRKTEELMLNDQRNREIMRRNEESNKKKLEQKDKDIESYRIESENTKQEMMALKEELKEMRLKNEINRDYEEFVENTKKQAIKEEDLIRKLNAMHENMETVLAQQESDNDSRYANMMNTFELKLAGELDKRDAQNERRLENERTKNKELAEMLKNLSTEKDRVRNHQVKFDLSQNRETIETTIPPPIIKKVKTKPQK